MQGLLPLVVMFGLMWVLLIRPQQRRVRLQRALVESLRAGDEVITSGGLCGTILSVDEDVILLQVAPGVSVRLLRVAVQQRVGPDDVDGDGDDEGDGTDGDEDLGSFTAGGGNEAAEGAGSIDEPEPKHKSNGDG